MVTKIKRAYASQNILTTYICHGTYSTVQPKRAKLLQNLFWKILNNSYDLKKKETNWTFLSTNIRYRYKSI